MSSVTISPTRLHEGRAKDTSRRVAVTDLIASVELAREARGMSWQMVSAEVGVSQQAMSGYVRGVRSPNGDVFASLLNWLGFDVPFTEDRTRRAPTSR